MKIHALLIILCLCGQLAAAQQTAQCAPGHLTLLQAMQANFAQSKAEPAPVVVVEPPVQETLVFVMPPNERCVTGRKDAKLFHGKRGGNFALGFFFGPVGLLCAAVGNPKPEHGRHTFLKTPNRELMTDPDYRKCYKDQARTQAVTSALIGWLSWIAFYGLTAD